MKGTVKWYNARKGYGFITPDDKGDDVFVHAITLKDCGLNKLFTGSEVTFEVDEDEKGKRAKNLKVTKEVKPETELKKEKTDTKKEKTDTKTDTKKEKTDTKTDTKKEKKTEKNEKVSVKKQKKPTKTSTKNKPSKKTKKK